jgi:septal ring factor EnvC (AmiA/AmiB activator)
MQSNKKRTGGDTDPNSSSQTQVKKAPNSGELSDDLDSLIGEAEDAEKEAEREAQKQEQKQREKNKSGCGCW